MNTNLTSKFTDLTDKIFGRLQVTKFLKIDKIKGRLWFCICSCGNKCILSTSSLQSYNTKSCGCLKKELDKIFSSRTHRLSTTRIYKIYYNMLSRCNNINATAYEYYGGRGITVCPRWLESFENFRDDMYESYLEHIKEYGKVDTSIDRVNPNGNYELNNCRWATKIEQRLHQRDISKSKNLKQHQYNRQLWFMYLGSRIKSNIDTLLFKERFGCTLIEFRQYIESKFLPGMSWNNHGRCKKGTKVWQFGHIKDCNKFDLSLIEDRLSCFHFTNLKPEWWQDNLEKRKLR